MSFGGFGAATAQAPAFGIPAAAPTSQFGFGSSTPSAPAFGAAAPGQPASIFGAAPAFGAPVGQPAPAAPLFGSTPAPSAFGAAPTASPGSAFNFSFNGAPAAAATPQPAFGYGGLGSTAAPAVAASHATTSQILNSIPGNTPYSALPEDVRREIDTIHGLMNRHRHTMANVQSLAPALLVKSNNGSTTTNPDSPADTAAGPSPQSSHIITPLPRQITELESCLHMISTSLETCSGEVSELRSYGEHNVKSALQYAVYPMESLAARRGMQQQQSSSNMAQYSQLIQMLACDVDRVETIPSPYLWNTIHSVESRVKCLEQTAHSLHAQFKILSSNNDSASTENDDEPLVKVTTVIRSLNASFLQVASNLAQVHFVLDTIKHRIRRIMQVTGQQPENDPFRLADIKELEEESKAMDQIRYVMAKAQMAAASAAAPPQQQAAAAPSLFGQPASFNAAPTPGLFGGFANTPTAAPTPGLFGSTTAPAPQSNLFGATPAAANVFGSAPAPLATNAFGAAPTPSSNVFGAAPAPPTSTAFGAAPAASAFGAAPAFGNSNPFQQQQQQPAPATTFGSSATTTTTKSKSKTRTGRSRR